MKKLLNRPDAYADESVTINQFCEKPNRIGRARMFTERSVGLDDPGMVAFSYLVRAVGGEKFN